MKTVTELIEEFEAAVRADEFKGGGDPADIPAIEDRYAEAKRALVEVFSTVIPSTGMRLFKPAEIRARAAWPRGTRFIQAL